MNIVAFSPHPDDVEIVMGGTIAKYTKKGHNVLIVLVTVPNDREVRRKESEESAAILGARLSVLDLDPYELAFNRRLVETFDKVMRDFPPDMIFTSWINESHQDHIVVSQAAIAAARKNTCSLYMYGQALPSGLTPYGFRPQVFIDVSDVMDLKVRAVLAHRSQVQHFGDQWIHGITARGTYLGFQVNAQYAEAFEVVKEIKHI